VKFAICNEIFQDWELEQQFETAAEVGFDGIEIAPFTISDSVRKISEEQRQQIRDLSKQYGLEVAGLHWLLAGTTGYHATDPNPEIRARTAEYMKDLVRFGVEIGGSMEVVGSPKQRNVQEGVTYEDAWEWFKEGLAGAAQVEGAEDYMICIEPLAPVTDNNFIVHAEEARQMAREINLPNVGVIIDTYSGNQVEADLAEEIRKTGELLGHYHCNDDNERAPGYGGIDFVPLMRALLDIGYDRFCSIEVFDFSLDPVEQCRTGLDSLKEALDKAGG